MYEAYKLAIYNRGIFVLNQINTFHFLYLLYFKYFERCYPILISSLYHEMLIVIVRSEWKFKKTIFCLEEKKTNTILSYYNGNVYYKT